MEELRCRVNQRLFTLGKFGIRQGFCISVLKARLYPGLLCEMSMDDEASLHHVIYAVKESHKFTKAMCDVKRKIIASNMSHTPRSYRTVFLNNWSKYISEYKLGNPLVKDTIIHFIKHEVVDWLHHEELPLLNVNTLRDF